ncbi:acyl carrier protein [Buchnera aphidicola]|uniref:acyl carrier protein n=1 Tax=Buchnera aphidicola TaxID=9 RepID=UPI00094D7D17|nr:acyl carrier protein [Buchnera aphidicola]
MKSITNRVKRIIQKQFPTKKTICLSSRLHKELKIDSLDFVELIMLLEEEFNIELFDIEEETIKTIQDLVIYITKKINK